MYLIYTNWLVTITNWRDSMQDQIPLSCGLFIPSLYFFTEYGDLPTVHCNIGLLYHRKVIPCPPNIVFVCIVVIISNFLPISYPPELLNILFTTKEDKFNVYEDSGLARLSDTKKTFLNLFKYTPTIPYHMYKKFRER